MSILYILSYILKALKRGKDFQVKKVLYSYHWKRAKDMTLWSSSHFNKLLDISVAIFWGIEIQDWWAERISPETQKADIQAKAEWELPQFSK